MLVKKKSTTPSYGVGFQLQPRAINPPATRCFIKPANGEKTAADGKQKIGDFLIGIEYRTDNVKVLVDGYDAVPATTSGRSAKERSVIWIKCSGVRQTKGPKTNREGRCSTAGLCQKRRRSAHTHTHTQRRIVSPVAANAKVLR